ncbi:MAG TPA: alpha/beta hydrolase [Candidatus Sulfotelmatobacter sp.]|jgi:haloacetate dehalogenase|nr:alpha/beta hydrolase [Candidatus Sulfotelmatobacter sp.]
MPTENSRRDLLKKAAAIGIGAMASSSAAFPRAVSSARPNQTDQKLPSTDFFTGFKHVTTKTAGATIHSVVGGSGPPLLLLHGYPQTHIEWRDVAPDLAKKFTVVASDLRGYGDSSKPPDSENHAAYSKRAMAQDHVDVMASLGFQKFALVGHDRGGRVAHRLALDHADRVTKLVILDIVPTYKVLHSVTNELATANFHWWLLIQKSPLPETLIGNSAEVWLRSRFERIPAGILKPDAFAEYLRCFQLPGSIHGSCEDYRAGATIDLVHDGADLDRKIACPVHVLWGERGVWPKVFDVLDTWKERASIVTGKQVPTGHFIAEERPDILLSELNSFLG